MSITAGIWLLCFVLFSLRGLTRPMWAVYAYLLTFFAAPQFWWWGEPLDSFTLNWSLVAGFVLVVSVLINWSKRVATDDDKNRTWRICITLLMLYAVNAVIVHYGMAVAPETSWINLDLLLKQLVLTFLLYLAIQTQADLKGFVFAIFMGCTYIGYEVIFNDAGSISAGRLEGIRVPGASNANGLSALLIFGLLIGGCLVIQTKSIAAKVFSVVGSVLILETILRCNSRGAFLGLICAGAWILVSSKGKAKKRLIGLSAVGLFAVFLQAGDQAIWDRFDSTFAAAQERDGAASSRIAFWKAASEMIADRPLGSGGEAAFRSELGMTYIDHLAAGGRERAVHNGYLDIGASWGIQGLALMVASLIIAFLGIRRVTKLQSPTSTEVVLLGSLIQAAFIAQLVTTIFLSRLDHEVFNWLIVMCAVYCRDFKPDPQDNDDLEIGAHSSDEFDIESLEHGGTTLQ